MISYLNLCLFCKVNTLLSILINKYFPEIINATGITPEAFMTKILYELDKKLEALEKK